MGMHALAEHTGRHAGHGGAGNSDDAGGARLPVDSGELAEEIAGADVAEDHLAAAGCRDERADGAADHEEDIRAAFAAAQDLLLGFVPTPEALFVQGANVVIRQAAEERNVPQGFHLPPHELRFRSKPAWRSSRRAAQIDSLIMFMGINPHPFKGGAMTPAPDDLRVF